MDVLFPNVIGHHPKGVDLAVPRVVTQPYTTYTPELEESLRDTPSIGSATSELTGSASPPYHDGKNRSLPSRGVTDETIDDAYVAFIIYCNPNCPLPVDTSKLRRSFRSPPRSDGKDFSVFTLWELFRKFDKKEIKTWIQLAIELGVELPSMERNQSTQKVQQYAVRLKRWMRAMHVDAFFEYCLGHSHSYYMQLPAPDSSVSDSRDGVPLGEDLALGALFPQWKPKRGRKRTEEKTSEKEAEEGRSAKRLQLDTSVSALEPGVFPGSAASVSQSAIPFSAFPDGMEANDPWTATSSFSPENRAALPATQQGQDFKWRDIGRGASLVSYPQSAVVPRGHHPAEDLVLNEPRSAIAPSSNDRSRMRQRHRPTVSSAWLGTQNSSNGKTRGRPLNRASASFSSSPAYLEYDEPAQDGSLPPTSQGTDLSNPGPSANRHRSAMFRHPVTKPSRLRLQVPQREGGPVCLVTPPSTLPAENADATALQPVRDIRNDVTTPSSAPTTNSAVGRDAFSSLKGKRNAGTGITSDDVIRELSGDLLRARITGRSASLNLNEAKSLATSVVTSLVGSNSKVAPVSPVIISAIQLGLGKKFGYSGTSPSSATVKVGSAPTSNSDGSDTVYTVYQQYKLESCVFTQIFCSGVSHDSLVNAHSNDTSKGNDNSENLDPLSAVDSEADYAESTAAEETWKQRYMKLRRQMQKRDRDLSQYKRKILESVMADV